MSNVHNQINGTVTGTVLQAGDLSGSAITDFLADTAETADTGRPAEQAAETDTAARQPGRTA